MNDNAPSFLRDSYIAVHKDPVTSGDFIIGTTALDPDSDANGTVTYSLTGLNSAKLNINPMTGVITAAQRLTSPGFNLTVRARDGGNRVSMVLLQVTIRSVPDNSLPEFQPSLSSVNIAESKAVMSEVTRVSATTSVASATVLYSIAGGNVGDTFSISADGAVKLSKRLNYAEASAFNLWIQAIDSVNGNAAYKEVVINVEDENDHTPEFEQSLYTVSVVEEQSIFGSRLLVRLTAEDMDSGSFGRVSYSLLSGNIDFPFYLDASDGSLKLTKKLDREAIARYQLVIRAEDGGGLASTTIVIVNVEDINDNFPRFESSYNLVVPEDISPGSLISTVRARDADVGLNANILYALDSASRKFAVSSSGNITVVASLDREVEDMYTLVVSAKNVGVDITLSGTATVTITVSGCHL